MALTLQKFRENQEEIHDMSYPYHLGIDAIFAEYQKTYAPRINTLFGLRRENINLSYCAVFEYLFYRHEFGWEPDIYEEEQYCYGLLHDMSVIDYYGGMSQEEYEEDCRLFEEEVKINSLCRSFSSAEIAEMDRIEKQGCPPGISAQFV